MICFIITTHESDIRPTGHGVLNRCIKSIHTHMDDGTYDIIIVDNGSPKPYFNRYGYDMIYRRDQVHGLTGAWNVGTYAAFEKGHDLICHVSDDVYFNESIADFEDIMRNHKHFGRSAYGPLSDSTSAFPRQQSPNGLKKGEMIEITGEKFGIHGWMFAFDKEYFDRYKVAGQMFSNEHRFANTESFQNRAWRMGGKSFIVGDVLAHHEHIRAWKKITKRV